jgi:serine/threonine protein kinase
MRHAPGDRIGPYLVRSTVDESESTAVLEVEHSVLRTTHALKILAENDGDAFARSLHHGARLQAMIDHPHVVRCTDAGEHAGLPWLVMDWMNGGSLAEMLDARGALHPALALRWLRGITRGLRALHQANVVHRDLKPSNVMFSFLGTERRPRISDLGLAKWLDHTTDHDRPSTLSMEFRTIGTPEYMAPEQSADPAVVDVRADLYSLGVLTTSPRTARSCGSPSTRARCRRTTTSRASPTSSSTWRSTAPPGTPSKRSSTTSRRSAWSSAPT